jgi:cyclopropane-fatty-acyl-phospholipid synthase
MLPSQRVIHELAVQHGFEVGQIESFGADYAETLRRWRQCFEDNLSKVRLLGFDTAFIRLWRFYLAYCETGFDEQRIDVVQFRLVQES